MYRKISTYIEEYLLSDSQRILCVDGARQVGKTYIIRELAKKHFKNYIEINMANDKTGDKLFENVRTIDAFYLKLSAYAGNKLENNKNTIVFIDEIQEYPTLFTLLKPLKEDNKYKYICSGSELGIALQSTTLIPMGSITEKKMYPMDFEEFLLANSIGDSLIKYMKDCFNNRQSLEESIHNKIMYLFKLYLLIGGMPAAVKEYVQSKNIVKVREIHDDTIKYYGDDATKYDFEHKLKIKKIYDLVPSNIENKVKRIQFKTIENIDDVRYTHYIDEFDYLLSSGIVLGANAISEPKFPLIQSSSKNLIKLYMNDIGLLTNLLYKNNVSAILDDTKGVNLGAVYETVVAQELKSQGHELFYYDRRKVGEVDYLVDDYNTLSILPLEIKSGKDYSNFRALPKLIENTNYRIVEGIVFSNEQMVKKVGKITYLPIYYIMFI